MSHNTRSKRGPLIDKEELGKVQGRKENDYWQQAMDALEMKGRIDPHRLDELIAKKEEIKAAAKKKGGSRRRTRRGRGTRSTRRR